MRYPHRNEWARNADDVLWRGTKLGLQYDCRAARTDWSLVRIALDSDYGARNILADATSFTT